MVKRFHAKDDAVKLFRRMRTRKFDTKSTDVKFFRRVKGLNVDNIHLTERKNHLFRSVWLSRAGKPKRN